ncbi:MAG: hypothetical protein AAF191_14925, partial [Verrucomicrobiota bacterium]
MSPGRAGEARDGCPCQRVRAAGDVCRYLCAKAAGDVCPCQRVRAAGDVCRYLCTKAAVDVCPYLFSIGGAGGMRRPAKGRLGRADVLRLMKEEESISASASFLGFEPAPLDPSALFPPSRRGEDDQGEEGAPSFRRRSQGEEEALPKPRVRFLLPVYSISHDPDDLGPEIPVGEPISDEELRIPSSPPPLPERPPLVPWSRLQRFVRPNLGAVTPGARVDVRRLMRSVDRGEALREVPRLPRAG